MKLGTKWIRQQAITLLVIKRIIGVAVEIEGVERRAIVRVERQPEFDALRQVWIRNEMTPERNQVFDLNDFDETQPGPWQWDIKRLAASLLVAARTAGATSGRVN